MGAGEEWENNPATGLGTEGVEALFMGEVCQNLKTITKLRLSMVSAITWGTQSGTSHENMLPLQSVKNNPIRRLQGIPALDL